MSQRDTAIHDSFDWLLLGSMPVADALAFVDKELPGRLDDSFVQIQILGAYFLNLYDIDSFPRLAEYIQLLKTERQLSSDVMFWMAFIQDAVMPEANGKQLMSEVLSKDPNHAYASAVLASLLQDSSESERLLRVALRKQPSNLRVISDLIELLRARGATAEADELARDVASMVPYTERSFGILNEYCDEVLNRSAHAERLRSALSS